MKTGKWELVIVWATDETDVYEYDTEQEAKNAGDGMWTALGNQIAWRGVREQIVKHGEV